MQHGRHLLQNVLILRNSCSLPPAPSSLAIQDLVMDLAKLRDADIVKLKSRDVSACM